MEEELLSAVPGKDAVVQFFKESFGTLFAAEGFQYVTYKGDRWYRIVNGNVLLSIHLWPTRYNFSVYYGYQPIFFPITFPTTRPRFINHKWTIFDVEMDDHRAFPSESILNLTPLYTEQTRRAERERWVKMFERTVFPVFRSITDVLSGHEEYKRRRRELASIYMNAFDGRLLLESVYLENAREYKYICDRILRKQLEKDYNSPVWMDYSWLTAKDDSQAVPVGELVKDLEGSREMLWCRINNTIEQSRKILQKLGLTKTQSANKNTVCK